MEQEAVKSRRIIELYQMLNSGEVVVKKDLADYFGVSERSIQRDLDTLRDYLADKSAAEEEYRTLEYDKSLHGYRFVSSRERHLMEGEMLAICKILLESRAFPQEEMRSILSRLMDCCLPASSKGFISDFIANEVFHYMEPSHAPVDVNSLEVLAHAIQGHQMIEISYSKLKGNETVTRRIAPMGILFSEFYFYLLAVIPDKDIRKRFTKEEDPYPTVYRLDRIQAISILEEIYPVQYIDRFQAGPYHNLVQYMYGGEVQNVRFLYSGLSIEAVLDRLPFAKVLSEREGTYEVQAETFGTGILMWLLSQGSKVDVISPPAIRDAWIAEIEEIFRRNAERS